MGEMADRIETLQVRSLLCVPLVNQQKAVEGLLLCASRRHINLQGFAKMINALGGIKVNVRVIAATHRDLAAHPENRMHRAAEIKPVVIDESLIEKLDGAQLPKNSG